jgi:ubiquitin C-terminal hydrolase
MKQLKEKKEAYEAEANHKQQNKTSSSTASSSSSLTAAAAAAPAAEAAAASAKAAATAAALSSSFTSLSSSSSSSFFLSSLPTSQQQRAGLKNLGNSCFANALFQALLSSVSFASRIGDPLTVAGNMSALTQFKKLAEQLRASRNSKIIDIDDGLSEVFPVKFQNKRQHDIFEFFDGFQNLLSKRRNPVSTVHKGACDVFQGTTKTTLQCSQCHFRLEKDPCKFSTLQLPGFVDGQSSNRGAITLEELVRIFLSRSETDNYKCANCSFRNTTTHTTSFASAPQTLVVQLLRFDKTLTKQFRQVNYPFVFKLPESSVARSSSSSSSVLATYDLVAVARHRTLPNERGMQLSGHFVADVREPDGSWWVCNDESVERCTLPGSAGTINDSPYLLLYEKKATTS